MGRREREGAQARAYGEGGQAGGRGQEQGTGRSGETGRADKLAGGIGGEGTLRAKRSGALRPDASCLMGLRRTNT